MHRVHQRHAQTLRDQEALLVHLLKEVLEALRERVDGRVAWKLRLEARGERRDDVR